MATDRLTLTVKETAAMLGISKNLAYRLAKERKLPGVIQLGAKRLVISRSQIESLLRGGVSNE